jgi:uncharacterized protein
MPPPNQPPVELLILQSTPFCNLDCSYCYLPNRTDRRRMERDVLALVADRIVRAGWLATDAAVIWHAGEPLVVPPSYYDAAIEMLNDAAGRPLHYGVQTNGTLIDDAWIDLFRRRRIHVGLSIDGPRELHNARRRSRSGTGSFDAAMRGLHAVAAAGLDFGVITVLTAETLKQPEELFDFYVANGIHDVSLNIEEIEGINRDSSLEGADEAFRRFLDRFWSLAEAHTAKIRIREIAATSAAILDPGADSYGNPQVEPFRMLSVDTDGGLSTFSPELLGVPGADYSGFRFGDLRKGGPEQILADPSFQRAQTEIQAGVAACRRACPYFHLCQGGAPANKFFETGRMDTTETLFCRLTKQAVIDVALDRLERRLVTQPV